MTYIEVAYVESEKQWVATSVCCGSRSFRCSDEDYNALLDEVSNWARLLQADVREI